MANRRMPVALVLAASLALAACATLVAPDGPTDEDVETYTTTVLDGTWEQLELPEGTPRPTSDDPEVLGDPEWLQALSTCLSGLGLTSWGMSSDSSGYSFSAGDGGPLPVEQRLGTYACLKQHRQDPVQSGALMTDGQRDYLWAYYERWLVPCIQHRGYRVLRIPSRAEFDRMQYEAWVWSPYHGLPDSLTQRDYEELFARCGPERGALAGGLFYFG